MRPAFPVLLVALAIVACSCDGDDDAGARPTVEALLGGTSMADTPWPSDVFLHEGRLAVTSIPLEGKPAVRTAMAAALSEMDGAPTYGSVFFPVTGELPNGPVSGRARWIDLDDAHTVETKLWYRKLTSEIVAMAPPGEVLVAGHRYAVLVESADVAPSGAMRDAIEGRGPLTPVYGSLGGVSGREAISAATVFTVGHPTQMVERMRDVVTALPAPSAKVEKVILRGAALDDFAGTPTTTRPGLGDPKGIVHDALDAVILGSFDAPSFLSSAPPKLGLVDVDAQGAPVVKGTERIPFLLTLPRKPAGGWAGLPLLVYQHGFNAGRAQVLTCANDYARAGYATIGIDAIWHGDRAPKKKDERHEFSGASGADGLADFDAFGASMKVLDFDGDPSQGIAAFDARYVRDNFRQAIVDFVELGRFLRHGDHAALASADPAFAGLSFDREHVVLSSESFGSVVGASAVAISPDLLGGVLSAPGGGIFLPLYADSPTLTGWLLPFVKTAFDPYLDPTDPATLPPEAERSLTLLNAAIAPGDPLSFAPLVPERKRNVLLIQARSDELIPNQANELLARAMKATSVTLPARSEGLRFVSLPTAPAPYRAPPGEATVAVVQLSPSLHTVFTAFTGTRQYQPEFPPFVSLETPQTVDNPTELAHALAIAFASSLRAGGPGLVEDLSP